MKTLLQFYLRGLGCILGLFLLAVPGVVQAADRVPETSNDLPFYARLERGLIHTDGKWAAIAFYRPPDCIRGDFNLLDFFDVPAAFGCNAPEPYLSGFLIVKDTELFIQSRLQLVPGRIMPVWFVSWPELESAINDDDLTIGELKAMPSLLQGWSTFYTETLHPLGMAQQTKSELVALGYLEDGRKFSYQVSETHSELRHVKIEFK